MEPWLDSLSDEWASNKQSSPSGSMDAASRSMCSSRSSNDSKSRIPHLSRSLSQSSRNSSLLRPRSARGLAKTSDSSILAEQTSSKSNVIAQKASTNAKSAVARKASSAFSGSMNSVQHHTIQAGAGSKKVHTPEWKRRLARGEDVGGNGCDLFGPTQLEGIFKQPPASSNATQDTLPNAEEHTKPWSMPERYQTFRASKSGIHEMGPLAEEDEDGSGYKNPRHNSRTTSESEKRETSLGLVRDRVHSFEQSSLLARRSQVHRSSLRKDSRMRTTSGQEEINNEIISPITTSTQNTVLEQALKPLTEISVNHLRSRLCSIAERPLSPSSDSGVYQAGKASNRGDIGELTSLSLPDDLSMGTQDFVIRGGFVNSRRGGRSDEGSFQKKHLSSSIPPSVEHSKLHFPSSPPQSACPSCPPNEAPAEVLKTPTTPQRPQMSDVANPSRSSKSPLKLFGNYDTFTNDRLLRRMSQFQHGSPLSSSKDDIGSDGIDEKNYMRISRFGKGDLDECTFNQSIERQPLPPLSRKPTGQKIFDCSDSCEIDDSQRHVLGDPLLHSKEDHGRQISCIGLVLDREPPSPAKDHTSKRRRTMVQPGPETTRGQAAEYATKPSTDASQIAGKKRKDARYEKAELAADPAILASRQILKPKPLRRATSVVLADGGSEVTVQPETDQAEHDLTEELADELASFGIGITEVANDSRKPSVTTQDFLKEATKIMQLIRQRGRPKSDLDSVEERREDQELNPDSILDLEVEGDETTADNFSRPPSRSGSVTKQKERDAPLNPLVTNHLQKYEDEDDLGLLLSSKLGSLHLATGLSSQKATLAAPPTDIDQDQEESQSSPSNIRIRESEAHQRKRKYSASTTEGPTSFPTQTTSDTWNGTTIPTSSSASSGDKGRIPPGKVILPDQVGTMTFDHASKSWVRGNAPQLPSKSGRKSNSEDDPLRDIPDLSIGEQNEAASNDLAHEEARPDQSLRDDAASSDSQTTEGAQSVLSSRANRRSQSTRIHKALPATKSRVSVQAPADLASASTCQTKQTEEHWTANDRDEEVEHEIRIHDGRMSEAPRSPHRASQKARAVTVAFSSPLASAIAYHNEQSLLCLDHSTVNNSFQNTTGLPSHHPPSNGPTRIGSAVCQKPIPPASRKNFQGRPVSRIEEREENITELDLSVARITQPSAMTPAQHSQLARPRASGVGMSMICLTPLSEFTLHQRDQPHHVEMSYVEERAHPTSLRQAHGPLALTVDALVKVVTEVKPHELHWEHLRTLDVSDRDLTSLHRLEEYCCSIEELNASGNEIRDLSGVPPSVRILVCQNNSLSNLTSWGHLQNLQYLDVSGNELESLDGLSYLIHLRELRANGNRIRNLAGAFDLDALLHLEVQDNEIESVDFDSAGLKRLHHLDLSNNRITVVRNTQRLSALRTLYLERNRLQEFDSPDGLCPLLQDLRLSCNQIEAIKLVQFPAIEVLHLDENRIHAIHGLGTARHLNILSLREQSESPDILNTVFSTSHECRKLYLSANPAPSGGLMLPSQPHFNLKYLELASCGLTSLGQNFGTKIPNCRTLNINFNAVKDLRPLGGCKRLNKLLVSGNRLDRIRRSCETLTALPLRKVDVRDNPVSVGFYPSSWENRLVHGNARDDVQDGYTLRPIDPCLDARWVKHLDGGTKARRRMVELLLADGCVDLVELNGIDLDRMTAQPTDEDLRKLIDRAARRR